MFRVKVSFQEINDLRAWAVWHESCAMHERAETVKMEPSPEHSMSFVDVRFHLSPP